MTLQLAGGAEGSKSRDLFSWGTLLCERKVMHGKFHQQRKSPLHTQKEPVFGNAEPHLKINFKKTLRDIEYSVFWDKGINFLDYFFDKGRVLLLSLQRHSIPQRLSGKKMSVTSSVTFFLFFILMKSSGIHNRDSNKKCWELPVGWPNRKLWVRLLSTLLLPWSFLSSGHHIVLLKAHPIKVRNCAHPQIPLHQEGRLRNLLELVRIAQT